MRASISKPTPFIYLAFEKTDPFIYLIIQNIDLFIYCPLIFCTHFLLVVRLNITVNSCNTKRISSLEKSLSEKYVHIPGCQKNGAFHIGIQKNWAIDILLVEKRGPVIYLAVLKNGAIRHAHPYYAICRKLPPPPPQPPHPPPPPPPHPHPRAIFTPNRQVFQQNNLYPDKIESIKCSFTPLCTLQLSPLYYTWTGQITKCGRIFYFFSIFWPDKQLISLQPQQNA